MIVPPESPDARSSWPPLLCDDVQALLKDFQQGDIVSLKQLIVTAVDGFYAVPAPLGAVVLSQTCDLVQSNRQTVQLALLVVLPANEVKPARLGRRPRFVAVPGADGGDTFAAS